MNDYAIDIAEDSFISRWPKIMRWILVLPSSIIGCLLASVLYLLFDFLTSLFYVGEKSDWYSQLVSSGILGYTFVYFGAYMAPKHQFKVAVFLIVLLTVLTTVLFFSSFIPGTSVGPIKMAIHSLVILIAGGIAMYSFKNFDE